MTEDLLETRFEGRKLVLETAQRSEAFDSRFLVAVLLVYIAKGDGKIVREETDQMLALISDHFHMRSAESLELLTRAMTAISEDPELGSALRASSVDLEEEDKRALALMMLKVLAADGKVTVEEMESLRTVAEIVGISARMLHEAYDRHIGGS